MMKKHRHKFKITNFFGKKYFEQCGCGAYRPFKNCFQSIKKQLGNILKNCRLHNKLSKKELAEIAGVTTSYISALENGKRNVTIRTIEKFCKILEIWIHFYLTGEEARISFIPLNPRKVD